MSIKLLNGIVTKLDDDSNIAVKIDGRGEYIGREYLIYMLPQVGDKVSGVIDNGEFIIYAIEKFEEGRVGGSLGWSLGKLEMIDYLSAYGYDISDFDKVVELAKTVFLFGFEYDSKDEEFTRGSM